VGTSRTDRPNLNRRPNYATLIEARQDAAQQKPKGTPYSIKALQFTTRSAIRTASAQARTS
jgi:hypothetical protein